MRGTVERVCKVCGVAFLARLNAINRGGGGTCSKRCSATIAGRSKSSSAQRTAGLACVAKYADRFPRVANTNHGQVIRRLVKRAIGSGALVRPETCQDCGKHHAYIDAHHEDYSKPLAVIWLCKSCHKLRHYRAEPALEGRAR